MCVNDLNFAHHSCAEVKFLHGIYICDFSIRKTIFHMKISTLKVLMKLISRASAQIVFLMDWLKHLMIAISVLRNGWPWE